MFRALNNIDKRARFFLFSFLNIIFFSALSLLLYWIYINRSFETFDIFILKNGMNDTIMCLMLSLCECVGGALFLDYIFRKSEL